MAAALGRAAHPGRPGFRPGLPALVITGYAAAAADFPAEIERLSKPYRRAALLDLVADLLRSVDLSASA